MGTAAEQAVRMFIDAINAHDTGRIRALMTEDHLFIDAYGPRQTKAEMAEGWPGYFAWFPDYRIEAAKFFSNGDAVVVFGFASGTYHGEAGANSENRWRLPVAWRAVARDGKARVWQVYCDSKIPFEFMDAASRDRMEELQRDAGY